MSGVDNRWLRDRYRLWRKQGLCARCGKVSAKAGKSCCGGCAEKLRVGHQRYAAKLPPGTPRFREWTMAENGKLRDLYSTGLDLRGIGRALYRTPEAVRCRVRDLKLTRSAMRVWGPDRLAELQRLHDMGLLYADIARMLGVTKTAVTTQAHLRGLVRGRGVRPEGLGRLEAGFGATAFARCKCGLLLPCWSCIPTAVEYATRRVDGGSARIELRSRAA